MKTLFLLLLVSSVIIFGYSYPHDDKGSYHCCQCEAEQDKLDIEIDGLTAIVTVTPKRGDCENVKIFKWVLHELNSSDYKCY